MRLFEYVPNSKNDSYPKKRYNTPQPHSLHHLTNYKYINLAIIQLIIFLLVLVFVLSHLFFNALYIGHIQSYVELLQAIKLHRRYCFVAFIAALCATLVHRERECLFVLYQQREIFANLVDRFLFGN